MDILVTEYIVTCHKNISIYSQIESWEYLKANEGYLKNVLNSINGLQNTLDKLCAISTKNENECNDINSKCEHLIEEQKNLEHKASELKNMVQYFIDYNQIRARLSSINKIDILTDRFYTIVKRVNECIQFFQRNVCMNIYYVFLLSYMINYNGCYRKILKNQLNIIWISLNLERNVYI